MDYTDDAVQAALDFLEAVVMDTQTLLQAYSDSVDTYKDMQNLASANTSATHKWLQFSQGAAAWCCATLPHASILDLHPKSCISFNERNLWRLYV